MITAKIIADSINPAGSRLTSCVVTYPRFIHSELMTHCLFARNAASSRAIPFSKMVQAVESNPAMPEFWGAEKPGMQSGGQVDDATEFHAKKNWIEARNAALIRAEELHDIGIHKSLCNRLLEPFSHITTLVTAEAVAYQNYFSLRAHLMAQPEFQVLAYRMLSLYVNSTPKAIEWNGWHVPEFRGAEAIQNESHWIAATTSDEERIKIATARCARLSYLTFDGEFSPAKDIELHDRLAASGHWSPFEHCAQARPYDDYKWGKFDLPQIARDEDRILGLSHWEQYRKQFPNECAPMTLEQLQTRLAEKPEWITL